MIDVQLLYWMEERLKGRIVRKNLIRAGIKPEQAICTTCWETYDSSNKTEFDKHTH